MPRSSRTSELQYIPEIEKTARNLRREARLRKQEISSPEQNLELDLIELFRESPKEEVMANEQRTLRELAAPDLNQQPLCIAYPNLEVGFELKSGLIHLLPAFHGLENEDPHKHLKEFHVVCSSMRPQ